MFDSQDAVGHLVLEHARAAEVLRRHAIDFCCHGELSLAEACALRGLDLEAVCGELRATLDEPDEPPPIDPRTLSTEELVEQIVVRHHGYLREALPFVVELSEIVSAVHGIRDSRLVELHSVVQELQQRLLPHLEHEEKVLFPALCSPRRRGRATSKELSAMMDEHREVGGLLLRLRGLTDEFEPPDGTCTTHRSLLAELEALEADVFQHVHLENYVLVPRFEGP